MSKSFLVKRSIRLIIVFFIIILINFLLPRVMPGNPATILANEYQLPPEAVESLEELLKLDRPLSEQFIAYLYSLFTGQWGYSYKYYPTTVFELIMQRLPWTLLLLGTSSITVFLMGVALGIVAGWRRGTRVDAAITFSAVLVYAIPYYWLALTFQFVFGNVLGWFPISQALTPGAVYNSVLDYIADVLWHLTLPVLAITLTAYATYTLVTRNTMVDVLSEDFIMVDAAKGLPQRKIMWHAARNAILPPVTLLAIRIGHIVGGAVFTETVFSYPGVGYLIYESIIFKDYPVLNAAFFMLALTVIIANFIADLIYSLLDPRVKYER